jgi:hypothetical protein
MSYGLSQFDTKMVDSWNDVADLYLIAEELGHRNRASARSLRGRIVARIVELGAEPPALPEASEQPSPEVVGALKKRIAELEEEVAQLKRDLELKSSELSALQANGSFAQQNG